MVVRADSGTLSDGGILRRYSALLIRTGRLVDVLIIFATLYMAVRWFGETWTLEHAGIGLLFVLVFELTTSASRMYRSRRVVRLRHELFGLLYCWSLSSALVVFAIVVLLGTDDILIRIVLLWLGLAVAIIAPYHVGVRLLLRYARHYGYDARRVAFVGANEITAKLRKIFETHPWVGMNVLGVFDDRITSSERITDYPVSEISGSAADLIELARSGEVDMVYITLPMAAEKRNKGLIDDFSDTTASIYYCPGLFNFGLMNARADDVFGQPVISVIESPFVGYNGVLKRFEDLVLLVLLLPFLNALIVMISIAVALTSPGPIFFRQSRSGLDGKGFMMWKFRTMYTDNCAAAFSQARRNDSRVTPLGRFLRATSLDELPQFFNVLTGDMSIVGPRPHPDVVNEDHRTRIHRYMVRHKVRPGITGLAQVSGLRGETETDEKMEQRIACDLEYIKSWSIWLDIKILYRTLFALRGKHVY